MKGGKTMNNPRRALLALAAAAVAAFGCNSSTTSTGPAAAPQSEIYQYTAYDSGGVIVATGSLTLGFNQSAVEGQRDIKGNAPEAGTGAIAGQELADGSVQIELNPGDAAMVILQGKFAGGNLTGSRLLDTGGPPLNRGIGTFTLYPSGVGTH